MSKLDRAGFFRGIPMSWAVVESKNSPAVSITIQWQITAQLEAGQWTDWTTYEPVETYSTSWVIGKDGNVGTFATGNLLECLGWNGDFAAVDGPPPKVECRLECEAESWTDDKGDHTTFKVKWINRLDSAPGQIRNAADGQKLRDLNNKYGSKLRGAMAAMPKPVAREIPATGTPSNTTDTPFV